MINYRVKTNADRFKTTLKPRIRCVHAVEDEKVLHSSRESKGKTCRN